MSNTDKGKLHNRKERIFFLYRNYLLEGTLNDSNESIHGEEYNFSDEQKTFIDNILKNIETLETEIFKHLPTDWKWERFNNVEKAILLNATAEILLANNKKAIVIEEALEFAKKYCGEKSQPLINAMIDKIEIDEKIEQ